jgi:formate hydrogenlyase transcriptional activator
MSALREQEAQLRQVLEFTPQIVTVFGAQRERLYINQVALDYVGIERDNWLNTRNGTELHPEDWAKFQAQWDRAALRPCDSGFDIEVRLLRHDRVYRWHACHYNAVRDDGGAILRWYFVNTDIDDRKKSEEKLLLENLALRESINQAHPFEEIIGSSEPLHKVLAEVQKLALSDSTVLILGETGTGKELIARAIHKHSARSTGTFIAVNCGTIPPSLIATELFGHEKGAFTGATQRRLGRFEAANGGTVFLDEVGDLPLDAQIALLRVLQEREIERVGSDKPIPVNVRVLAATHRDLQKLVQDGKFRGDLFYRLNVLPVLVPSLRERADDVPTLARYFIDRFGKKSGKKFRTVDQKTIADLQAYEWPGNVRELQNVIERAVTLSESDIFSVDEAWLKREPPEVKRSSLSFGRELLAREKATIEEALSISHGRVSGSDGAAAKLGIPTTTLDSKIKRLGIDKYRFKGSVPTS